MIKANNSDITQKLVPVHLKEHSIPLEIMLYSRNIPEKNMIRPALPDDLEDLVFLLENQFQEHRIPFETGELSKAFKELLNREELGLVLVALQQDQIIGFAAISLAWTLEHGGKTAWLDELYLLPEYREGGLGSKLLEAVIAETRQLGCLAIDLEVEQEHFRAENLYKRFGFEKLQRSRWAKMLREAK